MYPTVATEFFTAGHKVPLPEPLQFYGQPVGNRPAADGQRTQVSMTVTCDPASSPTDDDPPPAEPSDPIKSKIDVPANVDASGPADAKRLKAGLWVGTPIGGGPGGITFSVAPSGAIIDEQGGQPLTARAPQQCGSAQGLIASGLGKVTLLHSLTAAPAGSYPREARYLKQNIASNGGVGGQINLVLSFHGDDSGTATLSAAQPARPLSFSCLIPAQSFAIRHSASPNPPAATNDGLPYETGESGATQPGPLRATTTTLACNRGPLPTSDATCEATVIDSDKGVLTLPAGTVKWTLERGSLPNGDTCKLIPHPYSASMARCSIVYRPDAAGIPAATRIPVTAKYEGSTQHARSEATTEGIDPLTIVCVGLWSNDCEGKVPKPAPVETCVAAWQQCEGFKGSKNTGALDISGLPDKSPEAGSTKTPPFQFRPPQEVKAPIECDDEEPGDGDTSGTCVISTSVSGAIEEFASAATGDAKRDAERNARIQEFARDVLSLAKAKSTGSSKDDDKQLAAFKKVVEKAFSEPVDPNRTITPHPARAKLEAEKEWIRKKLAYMEQHFGPNAAIAQRESFARFLAAAAELFNRKTATLILRGGSDALDEGTQKAIDEFARSRFDIVRKAYDDFPTEPINQAPRELFNGESDCARTFASDAQVRAACLTFLAQVNAAVIRDRQAVRESTTKAIKELQRRVLTTQMGAVGRSLLHARRRTPFVFASGVTQIPVGKSGKLKLRFPPEAQGVLKMLRLLGATSITTTVTTTTVRAGIRTTTSRKVRLKLG
jgi:hypothetical protein